jgi:hypothetical protein
MIYKCVPIEWLWLPPFVRKILGWCWLEAFTLSFFSPLLCTFLLIPPIWQKYPVINICIAGSLAVSMLLPLREWIWSRKLGQLWYEIFDFHCNKSAEELQSITELGEKEQLILAMHPHGIVPFQAVLWAAYCDQYLPSIYGFGAAADVVAYVPFLRNVLGWLTAGSATYKVLKRGLMHGDVQSAIERKPKHLFILPGGIAEIFVSRPQSHDIVFKSRRGICRLAIETKASLIPCYVFGGTDFFENLATNSGLLAKISRSFRIGVTIFWGRFGLPIPYSPKVTMVIGDPIPLPSVEGEKGMDEAVNTLHAQFMEQMQALFDKYKAAAGYPDAILHVT